MQDNYQKPALSVVRTNMSDICNAVIAEMYKYASPSMMLCAVVLYGLKPRTRVTMQTVTPIEVKYAE